MSAFQSLMSGPDCAVQSNPLTQVLKHTDGDRSLQRDRIGGPSTSRLQYLPTTRQSTASEADVAHARQFFGNSTNGPSTVSRNTDSFSLPVHGDLARQSSPMLDSWSRLSSASTSGASRQEQHNPSVWGAEFGTPSAITQPMSQSQERSFSTVSTFQPRPFYTGTSMPIMHSPSPSQISGKGKGKATDADFEAEFARIMDFEAQKGASIREATDDDVEGVQSALEATRIDADPANLGFPTVWEQMQNSDLPPPQEDMAKWESEFNQLMQGQRDDLYGQDFNEAFQTGMADDATKFDNEGIPIFEPYQFEAKNSHLNDTSPLQAAKDLLANNGSLSEAALMLEAAIQKGDLGKGGYEAWILLGETRSMDEREEQAIRALQEGVQRAEAVGGDAIGEGMISLAVSYTNETYERAAHALLMRWLRARYPHFQFPEEPTMVGTGSPWASHERATNAYLTLARDQHSKGVVDPDVQIGLGVLSYSNGQYDRARDCFQSALSARPTDYLLWNRYGSCLSNGNEPEAALGAYREALNLRPTYTRAIYNVGVACLNIGAYKESAEHFLSALALQETADGTQSEQLWSTLQRALSAMHLENLAAKAVPGARVETFRAEGFDF